MSTMPATLPKPPTDDKRWRIVDAAMRRQGYDGHGLIEALHAVQQAFGFLDETAMRYVAKSLRVPYSKVYAVATFYHFFTLKPQGKHTCVVCLGTACYIKGAGEILKGIGERFKIKEGQTTEDGELSLLSARCIGACGLAPAVVIDGEVVGKESRVKPLIEKIERKLIK
jgi:bidirectional [NiFe] hydrogenase diaphorase subunit